MSRRLTIYAISIMLVSTLIFSGCARKETEEVTEEKAPPDVIQLAPEAVRQAGISLAPVQTRSTASQIKTTAEIKPNENRVFHINSFVSGRVIRDNVFLGDTIRQGQTLAVVQNLEVAKIQASYIHELHNNEIDIEQAKTRLALAQKNLERERRLLAESISPRKDYQQAEAEAMMARSALEGQQEHQIHIKAEGKALLSAYGMSPGSIHSESIRTGSPVAAPRSGVVTKKNITLGDMVTPDIVMYEVADLSQVWLDVTVYSKDLSEIQVGQTVTFTTDSLPGKAFIGQLNYIQPQANTTSQTYVARAYLSNPQGLLKPGMFGQVQINQATQQSKPYIAEEAIQRYGRETFVFIPLGQNRYRKQNIVLGERSGGGYLVDSGIQAGQQVVGKGSFTLKAEILKSTLGGGE